MPFTIYDVHRMNTDTEIYDDSYTPDEVFTLPFGPETGACILQMLARNGDTVDHLLDLHAMYWTSTDHGVFATVTIPAGAGAGVVPLVDVLALVALGPAGLLLASAAYGFGISLQEAPATDKEVMVFTVIGRF